MKLNCLLFPLLQVSVAAASVQEPKQSLWSPSTAVFRYSQEDLSRFLRKHGINVDCVEDVTRNATADGLNISLFQDASHGPRLVLVGTNGVNVSNAPSRRAFVGMDGAFVAWLSSDGRYARFKDTQEIELPKLGLFSVDPQGRYFVVGEKPSCAWLGRLTSPSHRTRISGSMLASSVFARDQRVFVCGRALSLSPGASPRELGRCIVVEDTGENFVVLKECDVQPPGSVVDVDIYSDRLLVETDSDWRPFVYVYDRTTRKREKIGRARGFEFFLTRNPLREEPR
jgi:hypothetical protein